jgi:hypothetical protein
MSSFRRKSDQLLSIVPGPPDEALFKLIEIWKRLESAKKDGFRIAMYKESLTSCILKPFDV